MNLFKNWLDGLNLLFYMTQRIEPFFLYNSKDWTSTISLNDWPCFEHDSQNWAFFQDDSKNWTFDMTQSTYWTFNKYNAKKWMFFWIWLTELNHSFWIWLQELNLFVNIFIFFFKNSQFWTLFNMAQRKWTGFPNFDSKNWTIFTKGLKELDPKRLFDSHNKTFLWLEELNFFFEEYHS